MGERNSEDSLQKRCREQQPVLFIWMSVPWWVQTIFSALWDQKPNPSEDRAHDSGGREGEESHRTHGSTRVTTAHTCVQCTSIFVIYCCVFHWTQLPAGQAPTTRPRPGRLPCLSDTLPSPSVPPPGSESVPAAREALPTPTPTPMPMGQGVTRGGGCPPHGSRLPAGRRRPDGAMS